MILLSIGYSKSSGDIYDRLVDLCKFFKDKGINIAIAESDVGEMHYIKCILKDTEKDITSFENCRDMFYSYASSIVYDLISREYEKEIFDKILKDNYGYLSEVDLGEIENRCMAVINGTGTLTTAEGLLLSINRRNSILKKIEEFLQESSEIILDGFVRFRMKEINRELTNIIDRVVEEFVIEKEYSEFIKLLKYFVEIQESKYDSLDIIINSSGDYIVEDSKSGDITKEFFEDFNVDSIKGDVNKHDILISALITNAPARIVFHGIENAQSQETIDTVKSIFGEKITYCTGCEKCKKLIEARSQK
ncbi:putative sporulation protein YtxC [Fonticella tunisiensis]|uniref:Putative sporulation protein YtxC n=1 Tax=Fonticella tunisiensis TaxID=1096341 RepID=A0A4R7KPI9_9CLOT|nr:putative sporulation protein YtxC [Fonticella tunisiensis]TDT61050.1 putative sporulation protein YtxC [Fonticella tunisiensis]